MRGTEYRLRKTAEQEEKINDEDVDKAKED